MKRLTALTILACLATTGLGANLIVNGSFEEPAIEPDTWELVQVLPGWTIMWTDPDETDLPILGEVWNPEVVAGVEAYDGDQCVELDSTHPVTISQIVPTVPGQWYRLSYAWRPRPTEFYVSAMDVLVANQVVAEHSGDWGDEDGWRLETYDFQATDEWTEIAFAEVGPDTSYGTLLDAVSLCPWIGETAWAEGVRYTQRGNWATYVEYDDEGLSVDLLAGQTMPAGMVEFSEPDIDGYVTITITLNEGWRFAPVEENVKIQDYATAPSGNPAPGRFDWKTTVPVEWSYVILVVPENDFYGVHVEVEWLDCDG